MFGETAHCNSQLHHSCPHSHPKESHPAEIEFANPLDTQHVRIATARIILRTLKLTRKSCQALERCILLGLCYTLQEEVSQGQGWPSPGKKCWNFGGIKAAALGYGEIADQPHFGGSWFLTTADQLKTSHWCDSICIRNATPYSNWRLKR